MQIMTNIYCMFRINGVLWKNCANGVDQKSFCILKSFSQIFLGLPPSKVVTIFATTPASRECVYESFANYKSNSDG